MDAVFDLEPGKSSHPLRVARGMALVVVDETVEASVAPLEQIAETVRSDLSSELSRQAALTAAQEALDRGGEFSAVARRLDQEVAASGDLAPGQTLPGAGAATPELRESLFAPGLMEGDRGVVEVPAGALVFEVTRREPFDSYAFEDAKATLRQELLEQKKNALRQSIIQQMIRVQDVEINGELVEAYDS
jgi:parvulin-like peptidyl-prolyl isomerase